MTEHTNEPAPGGSAPEDEVARVTVSKKRRSPRNPDGKPFFKRPRVRVGLALLAIGAATFGIGKNSVDSWNEKYTGFTGAEAALIEKQRQSGDTKCLGRTLLLSSGVTLRETPNSVDFSSRIPGASLFAKSNVVERVRKDQEIEVKIPNWTPYTDGNEWISFERVNSIDNVETKPGFTQSPHQIGSKTVWVNYEQLRERKNDEGELYITEVKLRGAPETSMDFTSCDIGKDGRTTVNTQPVAFGISYSDGHHSEVTNLTTFPPTITTP